MGTAVVLVVVGEEEGMVVGVVFVDLVGGGWLEEELDVCLRFILNERNYSILFPTTPTYLYTHSHQ